MLKKFCFSLILLFASIPQLFATHIVGGEVNYEYLGNNQYKILVTVYRDCYNGVAPFDDPANVGIFNASGTLVQTLALPFTGSVNIPPPSFTCGTVPTNVCVEKATYIGFVSLPPSAGGYTVAYQRCCRNNTIMNIVSPSTTGATFTAHIPDISVFGANNNPVFTNWPPVFLCANIPFSMNHSATDSNGDSLAYELCTPFIGADDFNPMPTPDQFTSYPPLSWQSPYSLANVMNSTPPLTIDPQTGVITVTPTTQGQFVVGVCCKEYRNGVLISETRREFQFNVVACNISVFSVFVTPSIDCDGIVSFDNNSIGATSYWWDFGVPGITTDVSTVAEPSYAYPYDGTFTVTLIASNPNCSDTSTFVVTVAHTPIVDLGNDTLLCNGNSYTIDAGNTGYDFLWSTGETTQTITVNAAGNYSVVVDNLGCTASDTVNVTFAGLYLDLGNDTLLCDGDIIVLDATNPGCNYIWSTGATTPQITVTGTGNYWVHVYNDICDMYDTLEANYVPYPSVNLGPDTLICFGASITLDAGNPGYNYQWSNGSDNQTIDIIEQGTYFVNVFAGSCSDKDTIRVFMTENMDLGGPYTLCFRENVTINSGYENGQFTWSNGENTPSITVVEPGTYTLTYNDGMCEYIDETEVVGSLWVTLYLPNAFTPDDDGINDKFRAYGDGILDPVLRIYDRWGEQLFEGCGLEDAWDGRYNGRRVLQDVYVWVLDYKTVCNGNRSYRDYGHVVVIY